MKYLIILLTLFCSGCGNNVNIEPFYLPFFIQFQEDAISRKLDLNYSGLTIETSYTVKGDTIGQCNMLTKTITFFDLFFKLTEKEQYIVFYHEMGHCILNRFFHINIKSNDCPISIMYPTWGIREYSCVLDNWNYYLDELFGKIQ